MVDTPKVSPKNKKLFLYGGAIGLIGVAYYWRKSKNAAAATAATQSTDTSSTDTSSTDTGTADYSGAYGTTPSGYGYVDPATGTTINAGGGYTTSGYPGVSNNGQWMQVAAAALEQQGYDSVTVVAALGKYLAGAGLTNDQLSIVQAAIGEEGYPPNAPPPPHVNPPAGQTNPPAPTGVANGFYRVIENGNIYQIQNGKRYLVTLATWQKIGKTNKFTSVYSNWPGLNLPLGGTI